MDQIFKTEQLNHIGKICIYARKNWRWAWTTSPLWTPKTLQLVPISLAANLHWVWAADSCCILDFLHYWLLLLLLPVASIFLLFALSYSYLRLLAPTSEHRESLAKSGEKRRYKSSSSSIRWAPPLTQITWIWMWNGYGYENRNSNNSSSRALTNKKRRGEHRK